MICFVYHVDIFRYHFPNKNNALLLQSASAQAALQAAQALGAGAATPGAAGALATNGAAPADIQGGPNTVLRVIVEHMLYPIVLDVLHTIFQRYGKVLKIVTFTKNSKSYLHVSILLFIRLQ